jgi:hypothetical protein
MPKRIALGIAIGALVLLVLDAAAVRSGLATGAIPWRAAWAREHQGR